MTALTTWLLFFLLLTLTLRYLPFINAEASLRLQFWLRDLQRWLDKHD